MRRWGPPHNGRKYLLDLGGRVVHNLDREADACQIDEVKRERVKMGDTPRVVQEWLEQGFSRCPHCRWNESLA